MKVRYPVKLAEHAEEDTEAPPEGTDMNLLMHWFERMDEFRDKHMDYEKDYCELLSFCGPPSILEKTSFRCTR